MNNNRINLSEDEVADPTRRKLLGFVGTAALFAGGLGTNLLAPNPARAAERSFDVARLGLELDGAFAGYLQAATGGEPFFDVAVTPSGGELPNKSVGGLRSAPLELKAGPGMSAIFYEWIGAFLEGRGQARSGAVLLSDSRGVGRRLVFNPGSIVAVALSPLDATERSPGVITITIAPQASYIDSSPNARRTPSVPLRSPWLANAFRLSIRDLDDSTARVSRVEGIGARIGQAVKGASLDISNLRVTVQESAARPFYQWFDQSAKGELLERPGVLQLLSPDLATQLGTVDLINLGIVRVSPDWAASRNNDGVAKVNVELYCEQLRINLAGMVSA